MLGPSCQIFGLLIINFWFTQEPFFTQAFGVSQLDRALTVLCVCVRFQNILFAWYCVDAINAESACGECVFSLLQGAAR